MPREYSLYEAKARFSEIVRRVRENGETILVSYHGKPVAEIRPFSARADEDLSERLSRLELQGVVLHAPPPRGSLRPVARRQGGLKRFLADRDE